REKADVILHPVRMRILVAVSGRQMTVQQLVHEVADVPQTTLYRQINSLVEHGALTVVEERRVRGTVERVYALAPAMATLTPADMAAASGEDHLNYFSIFVTSLLGDFARYARSDTGAAIGAEADSLLYTRFMAHMTDSERAEFQEAAQALLVPLLARQPGPGRRPYLFAITFFPSGVEGETEKARTQPPES
ncbi:MAG: helix-turn-helix domain-containing protein, partial [Chloroflexia bacterium]